MVLLLRGVSTKMKSIFFAIQKYKELMFIFILFSDTYDIYPL